MTVYEQRLPDEMATQALGQRLGIALGGRGVVFLEGELGAGKTTLSRGILRGMGHQGAVKSPTFTLIEPYDLGAQQVYHFDLYRLEDPQELEYLGIDDYFSGSLEEPAEGSLEKPAEGSLENQPLCLVEWPDKGAGHLPPHDLSIELVVLDEGRQCIVTSYSERGDAVCVALLESA
ncbi:MAG: tRNA threonylcarbamoyladenosine biosynthesis protein TsaE [Candidatus Azotimanducaceae bacterium]|jgi:tRNA threonylcarbamoyladenosine biosynthesis protein TsaE